MEYSSTLAPARGRSSSSILILKLYRSSTGPYVTVAAGGKPVADGVWEIEDPVGVCVGLAVIEGGDCIELIIDGDAVAIAVMEAVDVEVIVVVAVAEEVFVVVTVGVWLKYIVTDELSDVAVTSAP